LEIVCGLVSLECVMLSVRVHAFGEPSVLRVEDVLSPNVADGQVLVRVRAAGVNPVDTYIRSGSYALKPALPYTPGMDAAGEVEAVGRGVAHVRVGQRVWVCRSVTGTYAQLCVCEARSVQALPDALSFEQGAAVGVASLTAWIALFERAKIGAGETVLVHGASGGVGIAAVQIAKQAGCRVIGTAGSERGIALLREVGCDVAIDHGASDAAERVLSATDGQGVHVVVEMLANVNLQRDLTLIAQRGRVVIVGNRGELVFNPRGAMAKDATIVGMSLFNATSDEWQRACEGVNKMIAARALRPVVRRVFSLADASAAHEAVMERGAAGKIVLVVP
jgi:NADPH:quinone reductase